MHKYMYMYIIPHTHHDTRVGEDSPWSQGGCPSSHGTDNTHAWWRICCTVTMHSRGLSKSTLCTIAICKARLPFIKPKISLDLHVVHDCFHNWGVVGGVGLGSRNLNSHQKLSLHQLLWYCAGRTLYWHWMEVKFCFTVVATVLPSSVVTPAWRSHRVNRLLPGSRGSLPSSSRGVCLGIRLDTTQLATNR